MDDKVVRQRIVGKYGFVDQAEDNRYHRPIIKKDVSLNYLYFYGIPECFRLAAYTSSYLFCNSNSVNIFIG